MMIYIAFPWFSKYLHVYYHILIICHHKEQEEGTDAAQRTEVLSANSGAGADSILISQSPGFC